MTQDELKKQAALAAVEFVQSGMTIGLGHGSTVKFALEALASKIKSGVLSNISGVPCSLQTESAMRELGIPVAELKDQLLDLTLDGADEVDKQLNLIKGGGGALLREKIVAQASRREIIMVDESKLSAALGTKYPLPVEVSQFGWEQQQSFLQELGGNPNLRTSAGKLVLTDQGNYLLDCHFGPIANAEELARKLQVRSGIIEHGLFIGLATDVIVAGEAGVRQLRANS